MPDTNGDILERLKQTSVFIKGPDGTGTGYLVASRRIGTALHVVKSWREGQKFPVVVGVRGPTCLASLFRSDPDTDAAVLQFDESVAVTPLPIAKGLKRHVGWEGYGFPAIANKADSPSGLPIDGEVKDPTATNDVGQAAILLYSDEIAGGNASPLHGFSGSPVVVDGALVGHLTKHIGDVDDKRRAAYGYVYACPIDAIVRLLDVAPEKVSIAPEPLQTRGCSVPAIGPNEYHVFLSYRSTDRLWALSLVARLEGAGLKVFIDQKELEPGGYLATQLESGLKRSRAAVVLVSQGWLESPWCQQELNVLLKRAVEHPEFLLIPLRLDNAAMPGMLDSRVWLDFRGIPQAQGENLNRLLSKLAGHEPQVGTLEARVDAAQTVVSDRFVAEIKSAASGSPRQVLEIVEHWRKTASQDVAPLIAAAEVLNEKGRFDLSLKLLEGTVQNIRVRQLIAFANRNLGNIDEGIAQLEALRREGQLDPETIGLLAGSYKARWLKRQDPAFLRLAYAVYREGYERNKEDSFNGINTAAMALQCDDMPMMVLVAGDVRTRLSQKEPSKLDYWDLATLGEANLLLGRLDESRDWYGKAAGKAAGRHQAIAVMRRQARMDLEKLNQSRGKLDDILPVPRTLVYFGHMVDADNRPVARFPLEKVGAVRKAIRAKIHGYGALHGFGQAARGTDIVVLEELLKCDLTATVILPIPKQAYLAMSCCGLWDEKFGDLERDKRIEFTAPIRTDVPEPAELPEALAHANREVQRRAVEYSNSLDETPIVLAVWDGKTGDGPGGTADAVGLWQNEAFEIEIIDITRL